MDLYYYCSYTESPVGYNLGKISCESDEGEFRELTNKELAPLIRRCFELGEVRRAAGFLSNREYFLLVKKLVSEAMNDGKAVKFFINFALTTNDKERFERLIQKEDGTQEIADAIAETIELDRSSDFGLTVCSGKISSLLQKGFGSLFEVKPLENAVCFQLESDKKDLDILSHKLRLEDLGIQNGALTRVNGHEKWACYGKKKRSLSCWIAGLQNWLKDSLERIKNHWFFCAAVLGLIVFLILLIKSKLWK